MNNAVRSYQELYSAEPSYTAFTPYRICPIGAHTDHQLGKVTGFAIDKGIRIACSPTTDGTVELTSLQFHKKVTFSLHDVPGIRQGDWADYLRGASIALAQSHELHIGMRGVIDGELPIGGLSSSAAVTITYLTALCRLNGILLTEPEMIRTARAAENNYVGVACGKLDQSCEVYCRKDHLLYMDMLDDRFENIPAHPSMKPYGIAVFFSGVERTL
ncbi:MAG: GHMP kinase, partial [Clostridia bacterium]|nr:GHMP kinase [Clostridia bacterium]